MDATIVKADALEFLQSKPDDHFDLICGSPPYELARTYSTPGVAKSTDAWVAWMHRIVVESVRVCKGLVVYVIEGQTRDFRYSCGPILLMADLHRAGICLRKPPIFHRVGIPGSGGPDWLRNDYEFCLCATKGGKLPWSDNTACGHTPKYSPGGEMSNRKVDGSRVNGFGLTGRVSASKDGRPKKERFSYDKDGTVKGAHDREVCEIANPGNKIQQKYTAEEVAEFLGEVHDIIHCNVGGGLMGNELCHENEAPYPEDLAEFFIRSFCQPGGVVCDPFSGSGTTAAVSVRWGRRFEGSDLRQSQVDLGLKRLASETPLALYS